jgi:hypothetical protein
MTALVHICTITFSAYAEFNIKYLPMFARKYFTLKRWVMLTLLLFSVSFLIAYLTGWTGESKHALSGSSSLIRRTVTSIIVGLLISFMKTADEE